MKKLVLLIALLFAMPAQAEDWREVETAHFKVVSSDDERSLVRFAEQLEAFHNLLRLATGLNEGNRPVVKVRVYLVPDVGVVRRLTTRTDEGLAGFYRARNEGPIALVPLSGGNTGLSPQVVLFHEYAHHFMMQYTPVAYPSWYVEGFAEIASTASFERQGAITFGKAASHRQRSLTGSRYPVTRLLDGSYLTEPDFDLSYGEAWLLAHYLTFSDTRRGQLRAYLNAINNGRSPAEAASAAFGDVAAVQREVSIYLAGGSFTYRAVPMATSGATGPVRLLGPAESALIYKSVEIDFRTQLPDRRSGEGPEVEAANADFESRLAEANARRAIWLAELEAVASQFAEDPAGWRLLADAQCMSEQFAACLAAANQVLALAPGDVRGSVRKAEAQLGLAKDLPDAERRASVEAARVLIAEASGASPGDPLPMLLYYRSYLTERRMPPEAAIERLRLAVLTIPQMAAPRLMLGQELIGRQRLDEARAVLRRLAYDPHESSGRARARTMLESIAATQAAEPPATN